jgi:hypothetical protein
MNRKQTPWPWIAAVVVVVAAAGILYFLRHRATMAPPPVTVAPSAPPPAAASTQPVHHPIEEALSTAPAAQAKPALPSLDDSDDEVGGVLTDLVGQSLFDSLFEHKNIVRRIVATVDNLPREAIAPRLWVLRPVGGRFLVSGQADTLAIAPENALRYTAYMQMVQAVDVRKLVEAYVHHYPLFQQAYEHLGYPHGYFNDRLIAVIDHLLATPAVQPPVALLQPHVLYEYADPSLESLSFGQKVLLRMGSDDAAAIKNKLSAIRSLLVKDAPPKP